MEFEGHSNADATLAVDTLGVDWYEQAAGSAESYLEYMAFSRDGLIEQLVFEGYSYDEAATARALPDSEWTTVATPGAHRRDRLAPVSDAPTRATGERLAAWLEELGLAGQLAAAGLPTYRRDCNGVALWEDPGTGAPLSAEQLADLDQLLHSNGDEPAHAVPIALVQLRRQTQVRQELLASPIHTYASLGEPPRGLGERHPVRGAQGG